MTEKDKPELKVGSGQTILEKLRECLSIKEYEFITRPGNFEKILKANAQIILPKGSQKERYLAKCKVQARAIKLEEENPNITITAIINDPIVDAIFVIENITSESCKRAWIRPAIKPKKSGRPKKQYA